jgi:hypothetical protein
MTDIILQKTVCPLCIELRASALQVGFSVIYPALLSPLTGFTVSSFVCNRRVMTPGTYSIHICTSDYCIWNPIVSFLRPLGIYCHPIFTNSDMQLHLSLKGICGLNKVSYKFLFIWLFYNAVSITNVI